jgi:hypothetical protein
LLPLLIMGAVFVKATFYFEYNRMPYEHVIRSCHVIRRTQSMVLVIEGTYSSIRNEYNE